jgi:hypothetical protein
MISAIEQIRRDDAARKTPYKQPLDSASIKLIEAAHAAKGAVAKSAADKMVKQIEALPMQERASILMTLAVANPTKIQ